tara:strand:+ start:61 stop:933 length:873 start_codon:yes stop_codon:yes gene_type:complete
MYFPKSQISTNLSTKGNELVYASNLKNYIGNYFKTSGGQFYSGNEPNDGPNYRLVPSNSTSNKAIEDVEAGKLGSYNESANTILLPTEYTNRKSVSIPSTTPLISSSPLPTENNYNDGRFNRYYLKKTNNYLYREISKSNYTLFRNSNPVVPYDLYLPIKINWFISGNLLEVYKKNFNIVKLVEEENGWFGFVQSFKDRFARYYRKEPNATFYTKGGELKIKGTNVEYIGFYHVHPSRGVLMEGQVHVSTPHAVLVLIEENDVLIKVQGIDEEVGTSRRRNFPSRGGGGY